MKYSIIVLSLLYSVLVFAQNDSLIINDVVVTGTRNAVDVRHLPMTVTVIDQGRLWEKHNSSLLPTVMAYVPGLMLTERSVMGFGVSSGAAGGLNLRGISGGAGQLMVLIDGNPQYQGIYGHPIADSYQTMIAERVEILRGPASVLYGSNAMGGVINIVTRSMHQNGIKNDINLSIGSYGTVEVEVSNKIKQNKFSSIISGNYRRSDNHRPRMGFEQYSSFLKLKYDFTQEWNAYVKADVTHFNASYPGSVEMPLFDADQWITRGNVSAVLENHYNKTSGALTVYSNFGRHKIDDGTADIGTPTNRYFRSKDALTGVSLYQSFQILEGNRITLGSDYLHIYGNAYYTSKNTDEILDTPNKQSDKSYRNEIAGYVDVRQELFRWMTIDAGIRLDHHSVSGAEWIPQAGIVIRPMSSGEVKTTVSKGFRNPTMRELYLYPPSNENLEPERIWNYELSWKHRLGTFNYGVNLFYLKGDNMIQTIQRKNVNTGEIENSGVEIEASFIIGNHWRLDTNHSYLHMKNKVVAAPKYKGYMGCKYQHGHLTAIAGIQYVDGLYTSVGDTEKKENFCLMDLTIDYRISKIIKIWGRGENLLAQKYEIIEGFPMPKATVMLGANMNF